MIHWAIDKLNRLEWWFFRVKLHIREPYSFKACVEHKVAVEEVLFAVANGKRDLLTREECRACALYLGDSTLQKLKLK